MRRAHAAVVGGVAWLLAGALLGACGDRAPTAPTEPPPTGPVDTTSRTAIANPQTFIAQCPTDDPAYAIIRQDFAFLSDGQPSVTTVRCIGSFLTTPADARTDELLAVQTLRIAYHMDAGTRGHLPWTPLGLYDWMKSKIAGINFVSSVGNSYCCMDVNGKFYFGTSRKRAEDLAVYTSVESLFGWLGLFMHEVRHRDGPGHLTGCAAFPLPTDASGCDATYDLTNLGTYGVQYWWFSGLATGFINVGIGCLGSGAQPLAETFANMANGYRSPSRFISGTPPAVQAVPPYGGVCVGV